MGERQERRRKRWPAPGRRRILDELRGGELSTSQLVDALGVDRHQVIAHLQVLRAAGLVLVEKQGRRRLNHLNPVPIQQIYTRWVSNYAQPWAEALVGLKHTVEQAETNRRRPVEDGGDRVG